MIKQLVPDERILELDELSAGKGDFIISLFDERTIKLFQDFSRELIRNPTFQRNPEIVSLSFWLRKSNIDVLRSQNEHLYNTPGVSPSPIGLVFHVCPANVDTMFVYSICISLLAGNKNIIRISSDINSETAYLLECLRNVLQNPENKYFRSYIQIINYPHNEEINRHMSLLADARVLWGGDSTISVFKEFRTKPRCKDIQFPNRISYSLIDMDFWTRMGEKELDIWAGNFYNDAYIFNQKGCSSPQLLFLLNSSPEKEQNLYSVIYKYVSKKYLEDISSLAALKYNTLVGDIISDKIQSALVQNNFVYFAHLSDDGQPPDNCGGGYFYYRRIDKLPEILPFINSSSQTLTYLGLSNDQLWQLDRLLHGLGIDRIVETGNALKFNNIWDGYNLLDELTRKRYIEFAEPVIPKTEI